MLQRGSAAAGRRPAAFRPSCCCCRALSGSAGSASAIDYDTYLSARSRARRPSAIRALQPLLAEPGMISLGGGMPNKATFPFTSLKVSTDSGEFELTGGDLEAVLQYSGTRGLGSLLPHLQNIQEVEHGASTPEPYEICVSTGSQDALSKAFDLFTAGGEQEPLVLVEEPTYSGSLAYLQPTGTQLVGVPCDSGGLDPAALDAILRGWGSGSSAVRTAEPQQPFDLQHAVPRDAARAPLMPTTSYVFYQRAVSNH